MTAWVGAEIAGAVANGIIEGLALSALLWLLLRLTPRAAAATRYALCGLALAFVAALPVVQGWLPRLGMPAPAVAGSGHPGAALTLTAGAWLIWVLGAWALGSLALMARVAWGLVALGGLKRRAVTAPEQVTARFEGIMRACPGRRRARVLVSDEVAGPMAAGVVKPAVLLPAFLVEALSEAELDQVLTHELAHIRRWDDWTNLGQKVVEALLFFHPAVIWIGRRLTLEREIACDDWVVGLTGTARPYATCLTRLAAIHAATPQLAPGALAPKPQLSIRVEALLEGGRDRTRRSSRGALVAAAATLAMAAFVAAPLAPVTVAMPAAPKPAAVMAHAAPRQAPVQVAAKTARVYRPRAERARVVARSTAPLATVVARSSAPIPAALRPAMMLYVIYVDGGDAGWIRILWVHEIPAPILNRT
ncbi:MAG: M56 family metallopeptidase [Bryobacteraceae bacterium]|jgi:beta-lactamase regulating signal transducer with metallopeptidase domain